MVNATRRYSARCKRLTTCLAQQVELVCRPMRWRVVRSGCAPVRRGVSGPAYHLDLLPRMLPRIAEPSTRGSRVYHRSTSDRLPNGQPGLRGTLYFFAPIPPRRTGCNNGLLE